MKAQDERNYRTPIVILINSSIISLLTYGFLILLMQVTNLFIADAFNISTSIYYFNVIFTIPDTSYLWNTKSIVLVYGSGTFVLFFTALVFRILYAKFRKKKGTLKLLFLWGYVNSLMLFSGSLISGFFLKTGMGYVLNWMYIPIWIQYIFVALAAALLVWLGIFSQVAFLKMANTHKAIEVKKQQTDFRNKIFLIPALLVLILTALIAFPDASLYSRFSHLAILLVLLPSLRFVSIHFRLIKEPMQKFKLLYLIALIALIALLIAFKTMG